MDSLSLQKYVNTKYILKGTEVVKADSLEEWAEWFEKADRVIRKTFINDAVDSDDHPNKHVTVSTVFIGIAADELFETMVFGCTSCPEYEEFQYRDSNFDDAGKHAY